MAVVYTASVLLLLFSVDITDLISLISVLLSTESLQEKRKIKSATRK
jgi:hypothetical protein